MKHLDYKGYTGTIEYSAEDELLFGKVVGIKGLISYEGTTGPELEANFKSTIDDYLDDCKDEGITPERPFKGSFNVRIAAELHRSLAIAAIESGTSQSIIVGESIRMYLSTIHPKFIPAKQKKGRSIKEIAERAHKERQSTKV